MVVPQNIKKSILIDAHNIHCGGGLILLKKWVQEFTYDEYLNIYMVLDQRVKLDLDSLPTNVSYRYVQPTIIARLLSGLRIGFFRDTIFCFGNLPPFFSRSNHIVLFLHNSLFFENKLICLFPFKTKIRLLAESFIFRLRYHSINKFLVQTSHMQKYLCKLGVDTNRILIAPFANIAMYDKVSKSNGSFICVSSGDVHKNLDKLILAWVVLAQEGFYPKLLLTFDSAAYPKLSKMLDAHVEKYSLLIDNLGEINASYINTIYQNGATLIFPSLTESLGLPLIEARNSGVDVIASELDYVRDVIEPVQTFDPNSSISIARAVKRYLGISDSPPSLWDISELNEQLFKS